MVSSLGRTLECTLCGLRGKRCHLTLHFKAKHNEVIDLAGVQTNRKTTTNSTKKLTTTSSFQPPTPQVSRLLDYCKFKEIIICTARKKIMSFEYAKMRTSDKSS